MLNKIASSVGFDPFTSLLLLQDYEYELNVPFGSSWRLCGRLTHCRPLPSVDKSNLLFGLSD
jgi:hypothetical protein